MTKFQVMRTTEYWAEIEAETCEQAEELACDLPESAWNYKDETLTVELETNHGSN